MATLSFGGVIPASFQRSTGDLAEQGTDTYDKTVALSMKKSQPLPVDTNSLAIDMAQLELLACHQTEFSDLDSLIVAIGHGSDLSHENKPKLTTQEKRDLALFHEYKEVLPKFGWKPPQLRR